MNIILPKKLNSQEDVTIDSNCIVVIGANGAGKTRFGTDIENRYNKQTHRISAQKSLSMPKEVSPKSKIRAESEFLYGNYNENDPANNFLQKKNARWGRTPNTFLLNDYDKLMVFLHTEEYEESIKFKKEYQPRQNAEKPITKLDRIQKIWEFVLPDRKLIIKAGSIETYLTEIPDNRYNASEMSDGERVVFYLIGEVLSVPENSIIVIDEPEMHLHKSIIKKLWDRIEQERTDCTFIYLTHDIDFASTNIEATKIWANGFDGTFWDYEILDNTSELPQQLYLEILGSRKHILFIEGNDSSIDYKLLHLIFSDYTIKPLGNCQRVFESTKSFNKLKEFHHIDSFGLIDRDRRTDEEVEHINTPNIWITQVAEFENFLLLEEIIKMVATCMMKEPDEIFQSVQKNVISFFEKQIEQQALEHTIARIDRIFKCVIDNSATKTFVQLENSLNKFWEHKHFKDINKRIVKLFKELVKSKNYNGILKVFNNKGLISNSNVANLCDLSVKNDAYFNYIVSILKQNNANSETIKQSIINKIERYL